MAHTVSAQNEQKYFQMVILACQILHLKGHGILIKNGDFFLIAPILASF